MPKTIKASLSILMERVKITQLRNRIRKMEKNSYLNLFERIELRNTTSLLHQLEQHQQEIHNTAMLSLQ